MTNQPTPLARRSRILASRALPKGFFLLGPTDATIGRGKECELVLLADEISRRHAKLGWDGQAHTVVDLGSANGTFVNGDPIGAKPRKLDNDDLITVGPFRLRFLVVEGTRDELAARFDPRISDTTRRERPVRAGNAQLAGQFSGAVLLEACQLIELSKRSGELKVEAGGLAGRIKFKDGLIVDARVGIEVGDKAARRILGFHKGEYSFEAAPANAPPAGTLTLKVSAVAMDILRQRDETLDKTRKLDSGFQDEASS
jgi:hypothetical protein